jgi:two-component system response regulator FlrC
LTEAAIEKLEAHAWPGNVRELENVLQRALVLSGGDEIRSEHLMLEIQEMFEVIELAPRRLAAAV